MSKKKNSINSEKTNAGLSTDRGNSNTSAFLEMVNAASQSVSEMQEEYEEAVRQQGYPAGLPRGN